jgi:hypothetical protein
MAEPDKEFCASQVGAPDDRRALLSVWSEGWRCGALVPGGNPDSFHETLCLRSRVDGLEFLHYDPGLVDPGFDLQLV